MNHDKSPYTPILSAARQEQLTALRTDVRRKLAGYRERRDQSATVLFQHLAYLRFDFILDEADELHAAYNALLGHVEALTARMKEAQADAADAEREKLAADEVLRRLRNTTTGTGLPGFTVPQAKGVAYWEPTAPEGKEVTA